MSVKDLAVLIGMGGSIYVKGSRFGVKIVDVRMSYGSPQYLIEPQAGDGRHWIDSSSFQPEG